MGGMAIVLVAVIVGVLLLQVVDDGKETSTTKPDPNSSTTDQTEPGETTSTTSSGPLRNPEDVRIQVMNGAGVQGVAGTMTENLKSKGYTDVATPGTLAATREGNAVQCKAGLAREAAALAAQVGDAVAEDFPATPDDEVAADVDCIVVVGVPKTA